MTHFIRLGSSSKQSDNHALINRHTPFWFLVTSRQVVFMTVKSDEFTGCDPVVVNRGLWPGSGCYSLSVFFIRTFMVFRPVTFLFGRGVFEIFVVVDKITICWFVNFFGSDVDKNDFWLLPCQHFISNIKNHCHHASHVKLNQILVTRRESISTDQAFSKFFLVGKPGRCRLLTRYPPSLRMHYLKLPYQYYYQTYFWPLFGWPSDTNFIFHQIFGPRVFGRHSIEHQSIPLN